MSDSRTARVVIVGASLAGLNAAQSMRRAGFEDEIILVGAEPYFPYDRPPLSKQYLTGNRPEAELRLRGAEDPDEFGFQWRLGWKAVGLDLERRQLAITQADESVPPADRPVQTEVLAYDGLVIATGAKARKLPGCELTGVHVLRTLDDAKVLKAELRVASAGDQTIDEALEGDADVSDLKPKRVCVIGAGFIGAEVASTARQMDHEVTVVEAADAPLARVLDTASGNAIADLHRSHGVTVRLGVGVDKIEGDSSGRVTTVRLSDGSKIDADVVVVGIGVVPATDWLTDSGLELDNGVVCDARCMASPGVFVAGDVARWPNARFPGQLMRVEQWDNAVEQGTFVGKGLAKWLNPDTRDDETEAYAPIPWFWSEQYDRKIQMAGIPSAQAEVVHGSIEDKRFVQIYTDDEGLFVGAMAWNRPRHAVMARRLLLEGASATEAREALA